MSSQAGFCFACSSKYHKQQMKKTRGWKQHKPVQCLWLRQHSKTRQKTVSYVLCKCWNKGVFVCKLNSYSLTPILEVVCSWDSCECKYWVVTVHILWIFAVTSMSIITHSLFACMCSTIIIIIIILSHYYIFWIRLYFTSLQFKFLFEFLFYLI